jgi:DNA polymerase III subunit epsilon
MPIPAEATAVHGISNEDVKDQPSFASLAAKLADFFKDADIGGFNILRFDIPLIVEEFIRAGVTPPFNQLTRYVDAMTIFHKMEKRDLSAAYKFYCNKEMENAHQAEADVLASAEIFDAQISHYNLDADIDSLHTFCNNGKQMVDFAGNFKTSDDGTILFNFGKNKGKPVVSDRGYLEWMLKSDFTADTKRWCRHFLSSNG